MHGWYESTEFVSLRYYSTSGSLGNQETDDAIAYYNVTGYPTVIFSGLIKTSGAGEPEASGLPYREIRESLSGPSPYRMEITSFDPVTATAEVVLECVSDPGSIVDLKAKFVVYEDGVPYNAEIHDHVARDIALPIAVTAGAVGQSEVFRPALILDPAWNKSNLHLAAFVQHDSTQEVVQAASSPSPDFSITFYHGRTQDLAPIGPLYSFDDIVIYNAGRQPDTADVRLIAEREPAGWSAHLTDGTMPFPSPKQLPLQKAETSRFHLEVTPASDDFAVYRVEIFSTNAPLTVDTIRFKLFTGGPCVLVVDDDGGFAHESFFTDALDAAGYSYAVWTRGEAAVTGAILRHFPAVIWHGGWAFPTLTAEDRAAIGDYLDNGGKLFVSGQDIGWELCSTASANSTPATVAWYESYLHARFVSDDSTVRSLTGTAGDPIGDGMSLALSSALYTLYPSVVEPLGSASPVFTYAMLGTAGAVRVDTGTHQVAYLAFSFETIVDPAAGREIVRRALEWFGGAATLCTPAPPRPARINALMLTAQGSDILASWDDGDPRAAGGFNFYGTADAGLVMELNADQGHTAIHHAAASPSIYAGATSDSFSYYQVVGVGADSKEGPN